MYYVRYNRVLEKVKTSRIGWPGKFYKPYTINNNNYRNNLKLEI